MNVTTKSTLMMATHAGNALAVLLSSEGKVKEARDVLVQILGWLEGYNYITLNNNEDINNDISIVVMSNVAKCMAMLGDHRASVEIYLHLLNNENNMKNSNNDNNGLYGNVKYNENCKKEDQITRLILTTEMEEFQSLSTSKRRRHQQQQQRRHLSYLQGLYRSASTIGDWESCGVAAEKIITATRMKTKRIMNRMLTKTVAITEAIAAASMIMQRSVAAYILVLLKVSHTCAVPDIIREADDWSSQCTDRKNHESDPITSILMILYHAEALIANKNNNNTEEAEEREGEVEEIEAVKEDIHLKNNNDNINRSKNYENDNYDFVSEKILNLTASAANLAESLIEKLSSQLLTPATIKSINNTYRIERFAWVTACAWNDRGIILATIENDFVGAMACLLRANDESSSLLSSLSTYEEKISAKSSLSAKASSEITSFSSSLSSMSLIPCFNLSILLLRSGRIGEAVDVWTAARRLRVQEKGKGEGGRDVTYIISKDREGKDYINDDGIPSSQLFAMDSIALSQKSRDKVRILGWRGTKN